MIVRSWFDRWSGITIKFTVRCGCFWSIGISREETGSQGNGSKHDWRNKMERKNFWSCSHLTFVILFSLLCASEMDGSEKHADCDIITIHLWNDSLFSCVVCAFISVRSHVRWSSVLILAILSRLSYIFFLFYMPELFPDVFVNQNSRFTMKSWLSTSSNLFTAILTFAS